jgi:ubiquinol-cytochrome c reductase cytochrome c subunit
VRALAAAILLALCLPGLAAADPPRGGIVVPRVPPGTSLLELGRQLYAGNCSSCHGGVGEGVRPSSAATGAGPSLIGVGARAADFYLRTGYMPLDRAGEQPKHSRVLFSPRQLDALIAYVASLGNGPPVPTPHPERGSVADGQALFTENCAGCHQIATRGGYLPGAVAPPLRHVTAVQVVEAARIGPYVMPRFTERQLSDRQLDSIAAYVVSMRQPEDAGGWSIGRIGPVPEGLVAWLLAGTALVLCCLAIGTRRRGER